MLIRDHSQSGFSLVELVVTLTVVGIIAAVAVPRLVDNRVFDERGFAMQLASMARLAAVTAQASNCATELNVANTGARLLQQPPLAGQCNVASNSFTQTLILSSGNPAVIAAPSSAPVARTVRWRFRPDGTVQTVGGVRLTVGSFRLTVDTRSGHVSGP